MFFVSAFSFAGVWHAFLRIFSFCKERLFFVDTRRGRLKRVETRGPVLAFFRFFHVIIDRGKQMRDRGFLGLATARVGRFFLSNSPPPITMPEPSKFFGFLASAQKKNAFGVPFRHGHWGKGGEYLL